MFKQYTSVLLILLTFLILSSSAFALDVDITANSSIDNSSITSFDVEFDSGWKRTTTSSYVNINETLDVSGNNIDLTVNGPTWDGGEVYNFDGTNDYLQSTDSIFDFSSIDNIGVCAWIKPNEGNANDQIIFRRVGSYGTGFHLDFWDTNKLRFAVEDSNGVYEQAKDTDTIPMNEWTHVCGVRSYLDDNVYLYVNGILKATEPDGTTANFNEGGTDNFEIGRGVNYYNGSVSDVRIYESDITSHISDIYSYGNYTEKMLVWYPMQRITDDNLSLNDTSLNNIQLTNNGALLYNNSVYFDGTNYMTPSSIDANLTQFSVAILATPNDASEPAEVLFDSRPSGSYLNRIYVGLFQQRFRVGLVDSSGTVNTYIQDFNDYNVGSENCFVYTYDGTTMRTYTNGVLSGNTASASTFVDISSNINSIGKQSQDASVYYNGSINKINIYNRNLTDEEISNYCVNKYINGDILTYDFDEYRNETITISTDDTSTTRFTDTTDNWITNSDIEVSVSAATIEQKGVSATSSIDNSTLNTFTVTTEDLFTRSTTSGEVLFNESMDLSGNGYDLAEYGATWDGNTGYDFDGLNDYLYAENLPIYSWSEQTKSYWFKVNDRSVNNWLSAFGTYGSVIVLSDGRVEVELQGTGGVRLYYDADIQQDTWYNLIVVQEELDYNLQTNSSAISLYLDGELLTASNTQNIGAATSSVLNDLHIGVYNAALYWLNGSLYDVRVYDTKLTADEVSDLYSYGNVTNNIVAWYPFERIDNKDKSLLDKGFRGNSLTATSDAYVENGYAVFDGKDDYFTTGVTLDFETNESYTVCADYNPQGFNDVNRDRVIIGGTSTTRLGIRLEAGTNKLGWFGRDSANTYYPYVWGTVATNDKVWNSMCVVYNSTADNVTIYHDGAYYTSLASFGGLLQEPGQLLIGSLDTGTGDRDFNGYIDDVYIFKNRVLTTQEIQNIHNDIYVEGAVHHFDFNEDKNDTITVSVPTTSTERYTDTSEDWITNTDITVSVLGDAIEPQTITAVYKDINETLNIFGITTQEGWYRNTTTGSITFNETMDVSGNGNDLTVNGATWDEDNAYVFDGLNDYIQTFSGYTNKEEGTIDIWFKPINLNGQRQVISGNGLTSTRHGLGLFIETNNALRLYCNDLSNNLANVQSYTLQNNTWYHAVGSYSSGNCSLYLNGEHQGTSGTATELFNFGIQVIGRWGSYNQNYFNGSVAKAKYFNYSYTSTDVTNSYIYGNVTSDLVAWYPFQRLDNVYQQTLDTSFNERTLTDVNANINNGYIEFTTGSTCARQQDSPDVLTYENTSWSVDFYSNSDSNDGGFIMNDNSARSYLSKQADETIRLSYYTGSAYLTCYSSSITLNEWHTAVVNWNADSADLYIDGEFACTASGGSNQFYTGGRGLTLGSNGYNSACDGGLFRGYVDNANVYNRILTSDEITLVSSGEKLNAPEARYEFDTFTNTTITGNSIDNESIDFFYTTYNWETSDDIQIKINSVEFPDYSVRAYNTYNDTNIQNFVLTTEDGWIKNVTNWYASYSETDDMSGNGHDITTISGATWDGDKSYSFDGNDYINTNVSEDFTKFTISLWFKPENDGQYWKWLLSKNDETTGNGLTVTTADNNLRVSYGNWFTDTVGSWSSQTKLNDSKWHNVILTYDDSIFRTYIDGIEIGSGVSSSYDFSGNYDIILGKSKTSDYYNGSLNDVRIYNDALSSTEVNNLYKYGNVTDDLVAWYPFQRIDNTNTTLLDTGFENNTLVNNGATISGGVANFDGTNDYMTTTQSINITSVSFWYKPNKFINSVIFRSDTPDNTIQGSSGGDWTIYDGTASRLFSIGATLDEWHQYAFVYDGSNYELYVDGQYIEEKASNKIQFNKFGRTSPAGYLINGSLADVRLYPRALTQSEISALYNNQTVSGAISQYKFEDYKTKDLTVSSIGETEEVRYLDTTQTWTPTSSTIVNVTYDLIEPQYVTVIDGTNSSTINTFTATTEEGWKRNTTIGTTYFTELMDMSGNDNDLTNNGATWNGNNAYEFDGVDDYLDTPNNIIDYNKTITFWLKTDDGSNNFLLGDETGYPYFYVRDVSGDTARLMTRSNTNNWRYGLFDLKLGEWNFVAIYFTEFGSTSKIYVNGQESLGSSSNSDVATNWGTNRYIGKASSNIFNGSISDFRVYDSELTLQEIQNIYKYGNVSKNLVAWHPFERIDNSDKTLQDRGFSNSLLTKNGTTIEDGVASFNTSLQYLELDDTINLSGDFSIAFRGKVGTLYEDRGLFGRTTDNLYENYVRWVDNQDRFLIEFEDTVTNYPLTYGTSGINVLNYNDFVISVDNTNDRMYFFINGNLQSNQSLLNPDEIFFLSTIGKAYAGDNYFNGDLDYVKIYDRVLLLDDAESLYNNITLSGALLDLDFNKYDEKTITISEADSFPTNYYYEPASWTTSNNLTISLTEAPFNITNASITPTSPQSNESLSGICTIYNPESKNVTQVNGWQIIPEGAVNNKVLYYPINEEDADVWGGNSVTLTGADYSTDRFGVPFQAYNFDTTGEVMTTNYTFNYSNPFTLSFWVKRTGIWDPSLKISDTFNSYAGGKVLLELRYDDRIRVRYGSSGSGHVIDTEYPNQDEWYQFTWTHTPYNATHSKYAAYVNGVQQSSTQYFAELKTATDTLEFGGSSGILANFAIDDIKLFDKYLTADEVASLYSDESTTTLSSADINTGDEVTYSCAVYDDIGYSNLAVSNITTIENTPPVSVSSELSTYTPLSSQPLFGICNATDYDGKVFYDSEWYVNNVAVNDSLETYYKNKNENSIYLKFDGDGTDLWGNKNATINSGATLTTDRFGNENSAYYLDDVDSLNKIQIPNTVDALIGTNATFGMWFNQDEIGTGTYYMFSHYDLTVYMNNDDIVFGAGRFDNPSGPFYSVTAENSFTADEWYYITGVLMQDPDGGNGYMSLYIDGEFVGSTSIGNSTMYGYSTRDYQIGNSYHGIAEPFNGKVDDLMIVYEALNSTEIKSMYQNNALDYGFYDKGENIILECIASDGTEYTHLNSSSASVTNTPPVMTESSITPVSPLSNETLTGFCNSTDYDGDIITYNYTWFVNNVDSGAPDQNTLNDSYISTGDNVILQCAGNDGTDTRYLNSSTSTVLNTPPVTSVINVTPSSPLSNDSLVASCYATDYDDDSLSYEYLWYNQYDWLYEETADYYSESGINNYLYKDGNWTADTGTNQANGGIPGIIYVTYDIPENASQISLLRLKIDASVFSQQEENISIPDSCIRGRDTLNFSYYHLTTETNGWEVSCFNGDEYEKIYESGVNYDIFVEEAMWWNIGDINTSVVSDNLTSVGDTWNSACVAYDGTDYGNWITSSSLTVSNTPPVTDSINVEPSSPLSNESLTLSCDGSDYDGDNLVYYYEWYNNDVLIYNATTGNHTSQTFYIAPSYTWYTNGANMHDGDESTYATADVVNVGLWRFEADSYYTEAYYEEVVGDVSHFSYSALCDDETAMPVVSTVGTTRRYNATNCLNDLGDKAPVRIYHGPGDVVNESRMIFTTSKSNIKLSDTLFNKTDTINATCTAYDGTEYGNTLSTSVVALNTPPVMTTSTITNTNPKSSDTLNAVCNATDYDGDSTTFDYTWYVNDVSSGAPNQNTLSDTYFNHFDNVTVECRANDGTNYSGYLNSTEKYIANTLPVVDALSFTGQYSEEQLNGSCTTSDYDTDSLTQEYKWYVNDVETGVTTINLAKTYSDIGDDVVFSCRVYDTYNYSQWSNSSTTTILNHGVINFTGLTDDSDASTEIGSTVNFNANIELYDDVDTCTLYVKPVTSPTVFDTLTMNTSGTTTVSATYEFVIPPTYTSEYDNITWWVGCNDTSGNIENSTLQSLGIGEIGDFTNPEIEVNTSITTILANGTIVDSVLNGVINLTTTFSDNNLFQASVDITCEEDGQVHYWEILDINTTTYNYSELIDLTGLEPQLCNITLQSSDDHTDEEIPEYDFEIKTNTLEYETDNGLTVSITSSDYTKGINTKKLKDRYNFEFDYDDSKLIRKYVVESDGLLFSREDTVYPGHFVAWNEETHTGNWVDFALPNSEDFIYVVNKINENKYEVIIAHKVLSTPELRDTYKETTNPTIFAMIANFFTPEKPVEPTEIGNVEIKFLDKNRELSANEIEEVVNIAVKDTQELSDLEKDFGIKDVKFNSIGGTNIEEVQTYFYIGGVFNITSNNRYDSSNFTGYTVELQRNTAPTYTNTTLFNTSSQNYIENLREGSYTLTISHPQYVEETYTRTIETQYDECEQELANVSTPCGGLATGSYTFSEITDFINDSNMFDNDTSTYATVASFNTTYLYANYTIPANVTFAGWKVTAFGASSSVTIPLDTDNKTTLQLRIAAKDGTGNNNIDLQEYNGTTWNDLTYTPLQIYDSQIFEEKMIWYTQQPTQIDVVYNTSQAIITFVHRNIKTLETLDNYTFTITDGITTTVYNITDGSSGITLPLNANVSYNTTISKEGISNQSFVYVFDYQEEATYTEYLTYIATLNFLDEATREPFDFSDPLSVEFLVKCDEETKQYLLTNETVTNSTYMFDVSCEYTNFKFILTYAGGTSYYRTLIVDPDDSINNTYYLIDLSETPFVYGSFIIDDLFGTYENPSIYIKKSIDGEIVDIQSDYTDIENKVGYYLIENNEYIVEVHSDNEPVQVIGTYSADVGGEKVISMYDINLDTDPTGFYNNVQYTIDIVNNSGEQNVLFGYTDQDNLTESVQFRVYADRLNGTLIYESPVYTDVESFGSLYVPILGYENRTLVGDIEITHSTLGTQNINKLVNKEWSIGLPLGEHVSEQFLNWFFLILLSVVAIYASVNTNLAALGVTGLALLFVLFGWFTLSMSVLALAILIAVLDALAKRGGRR